MEIIDDDNESFIERLSREKIQDTKAQRTRTKAIIKISGNKRNIQELVGSKLKRYNDTSDLRKHSAYWVMIVVSLWLGGVFWVLKHNKSDLHLSDSVLIALLTTTTVNVLGLPFIILQGLYPKEKEEIEDEQQNNLTKKKS